MDKALVIGLGMGQQYASWLKQLNYQVVTVDPATDKAADYRQVQEAIDNHKNFKIVYIGTPNWTHESVAREVAEHTSLLIIEKPGVENSTTWTKLIDDYPNTKIMMVRNNQFRTEMSGYRDLVKLSKKVVICWSRKDGVPSSPWFTDKSKAFGGVSRDLMPHLLSMYTALTEYKKGITLYKKVKDSNNTGIDDFCEIGITNNTTWLFQASWKNNTQDEFYIEFHLNSGKTIKFELGDYMTAFGGCPAGPYISMIKNAIENLNNNKFWKEQFLQDQWIHQLIEDL
jgi:predicted dehydrogenase